MNCPTLITPPARWPGLGLREMWRMRRTCLVLAQRSLRVRYRQMLLGVAWVLIQPLVLIVVVVIDCPCGQSSAPTRMSRLSSVVLSAHARGR